MPKRDDPIYFKAVLRPNPPLPPIACSCLVAIVAAINVIIALIFVLRGAWPVTPFMGLDVLILAWAFFSSSKAAKAREELQLTRSELRVDYYPARGEPRHVGLNPYWVQVRLDEPVWGRVAITLASHGRRFQIGSFLSPDDRVSFAKALISALGLARQTA
jgi:uncharacterized membrane protein